MKTWFLLTGSLPFKCISILRSSFVLLLFSGGAETSLPFKSSGSSGADRCVAGCYLGEVCKPSEGEPMTAYLGMGKQEVKKNS